MGLSEEIRRQLIDSFKVEQAEHVEKITQGLLNLEKDPQGQKRQAVLDEIFREAHSLKGAAQAVGLVTVSSLGHGLEGLLLHAKEGRLAFSPELFDLLYQALDAVEVLLQRIEQGNDSPPADVIALMARVEEMVTELNLEEAAPPASAKTVSAGQSPTDDETELTPAEDQPSVAPSAAAGDETIRVSVSKLDALMTQFSELLAAKIRADQRLAEIKEVQSQAMAWQKEWLMLRDIYGRLLRNGQKNYDSDVITLINFTTANHERLQTLVTQSNLLSREVANDNMHLNLVVDELQEEIKRVRMLPLSTITVTFSRLVRDLARQQGKQIRLTIVGGETEMDKRVLELVKDPLIHLLRNAIDHGIEKPEARRQAGKSTEGHITLGASQQGGNIVIEVHDDGDGLNLDAIRDAAVRKGLLRPEESQKLAASEIPNYIFRSGLSTSKIITDISGRGVGLDVVRQNVEELHGTLNVETSPNEGTTFTMTLPLTLASSRGLLVRASNQVFALPFTTVERMLTVEYNEIFTVGGQEAISYQDKPVALAWLEDLLELPPGPRDAESLTVVIVTVAEKRLGLVVDNLEGEQEIVIKSLGKQLVKVGGIAGATILGSGEIVLVLHPADLVKIASQTTSRTRVLNVGQQPKQEQRQTILVVDDSITTRMLEKNILEAAGYEVKLATDGEEALGQLVSGMMPDLIVSDINMPHLDGFQMTERVRQDERYRRIPVILVTSLDSPADKTRGIEVGADAYIVKSSFDQANLLETIEQLI